ncbi:DJ-1/PfpI family protein [Tumebacillus sp. DT12]|uniref:DJ-1/PfpI family protein n=1 Tax=Tumebacillus lacus TaxID=2995335 RepID=A0ABT3X0S4_9BACL|nr:DJ-1/PfpI family protein [Tumebacillus lacus]MCX7569155.1 DJ-1/PfpI family protein [Tumebacillus lacus]
MEIVILLFEGMTALDALGPYEVLSKMPGATVRFAAKKSGIITPDSGVSFLNADHKLKDIETADILVIPGGHPLAVKPMMEDEETLAFIRRLHATSKWTTSVCTGSLILGAAGLLQGLQATTHWACHDILAEYGATPTLQRVVQQGKIITAAGVSSGIDMGLTLAALEYGDESGMWIQLMIEYDPQPPFDAGSPEKAPAHLVESVRQAVRG